MEKNIKIIFQARVDSSPGGARRRATPTTKHRRDHRGPYSNPILPAWLVAWIRGILHPEPSRAQFLCLGKEDHKERNPRENTHSLSFLISIVLLVLITLSGGLLASPDSLNLRLASRILDGPAFSLSLKDSFLYVGTGGGFFVFNVEDPEDLLLRGHLYLPHYAFATEAGERVVYVGDWLGGVLTVDVRDPSLPSILGRYLISSGIQTPTAGAYDLFSVDSILYVAYGDSGLRVLDVSDSEDPREIGSHVTGSTVFGLTSMDTFLLLSEASSPLSGRLSAVNVKDPANPLEVAFVDLPIWGTDVVVIEEKAYVNGWNFLTGTGRVYKIDLFLPDSMVMESQSPVLIGEGAKITTDGSYLYVCRRAGGLLILDPEDLSVVGSQMGGGRAYDAQIRESTLYLANGENGFSLLDVSEPSGPSELSRYDTGDWTYQLAQKDSLLLVAYLNQGLMVMDVSKPEDPRILSIVDTPGETYGVHIEGDRAYLADGDSGFAIIDLSNPSSPIRLGSLPLEGIGFSVTGTDSTAYLSVVKSLSSPEGYLGVVDTRNPFEPSLADTVLTPGKLWDAVIQGSRLFLAIDSTPSPLFSAYQGKLGIVDISNPYSPTWISLTPVDGAAKSLLVIGNHLLLGMVTGTPSSSGGRILVMDISDPERPESLFAVNTEGAGGGGVMGLSFQKNLLFAAVWHPEAKEVQVYDLSYLPDSLPLLAYYGGDLQPWDVVSQGEYVYVSNMDFSLYVLKLEISGLEERKVTPVSRLYKVFPNPFSSSTRIRYRVPESEKVEMAIYNAQGQLVRRMKRGYEERGSYTLEWDGRNNRGVEVTSGTYFFTLKIGNYLRETQRLTKLTW